MKKTDTPPIVRQSSGRLKNYGAGRELPDIKFADGNGGRQRADSGKFYWMTDKSATLGVTQDQYVFVPIIKEKPK